MLILDINTARAAPLHAESEVLHQVHPKRGQQATLGIQIEK
jgi:hypothetical protein